jgi:hypothetical protein
MAFQNKKTLGLDSGIGPSNGMLKKIFNPTTVKKKIKTVHQGPIPAGGPKIKRPEMRTSGINKGRMIPPPSSNIKSLKFGPKV